MALERPSGTTAPRGPTILWVVALAGGATSCKRVDRHPKPEPATAAPSPAALAQPAGATGCVADRIGTLALGGDERSDCTTGDDVCRVDCERGSAPACFWRASALQNDAARAGEAMQLFARSCELGHALGCTNHAAGLWVNGDAAESNACARRVFDKACAVKEPYACGMIGRMIITHAPDDAERARGRAYLESACEELSGPPCKMLANHLESGQLGAYDPQAIKTLLSRACDGGDASACDDLAR